MKNVKRKLALASIMLCGSVALGLASLNDATVSASAETLDGFEVKSASLRVPDDNYGAGIRFTIGLGNVNLAEDATTGVLLIPTSSLGSNALTLGLDNEDLRTYDNVQWKNLGGGTKEAYLHLYDVPPVQYTSNISICAYVDTPNADPIYSNVVTASVAEVADWAYYNDTTLDETAKASLQSTYLTYKVVYHNEDDTTETTGIYNQTLTAIAEPTKVGYTFDGWFNQAGTVEWDFATTKVTSTTTNLYAKWTRDYSAAGTGDWAMGETTFSGAAIIRGAYADASQSGLYQAGDGVKIKLGAHEYAGFEATLKNPIDATSDYQYLSITAKGADARLFTIVAFNTNGGAETGATSAYTTREEADGFTTYIFRIKGFVAGKFRFTPLGDTRSAGNGSEIVISNFASGDYTSLRKGSDANTLFFTNLSIGAEKNQLYRNGSAAGENVSAVYYSTEMAYGNEQGSFKAEGINYGSTGFIAYSLTDADKAWLADTDYVSFYVYTTSSTGLYISVNYLYSAAGYELMSNDWTRVIVPASTFKSYFWMAMNAGNSAGGNYDVYFSKFVRYTAEEVTRLEDNASTDVWTLGSTSFQGEPVVSNGPAGSGVLTGVEYKKPYLIDGELCITFTRTNDGYITMNLLNPIEVAANTEMYVTVTMYNYGRLDKLNGYMNSSGSYPLSYVSHTDIGGGYAKVVLKCVAKTEAYTIASVRLDVEELTGTEMATQFRIKDIVVSTKEA